MPQHNLDQGVPSPLPESPSTAVPFPAGEVPPPPPPAAADMPKNREGRGRKGVNGKDRAGQAPAPGTADKRDKSRLRRIWAAVGAVILLTGGAAGGHFLTDPTQSKEYSALADESAERQVQLKEAEEDYRVLEADYQTLSQDVQQREVKAGERETAVQKAEAAVKARESAVAAVEKQKAAETIIDGTWTVGANIAPGTYVTAAEVGSSCYWGIYRSGSNGEDIIQNDIPGGGRPSVTLAEGQDFKSSRCGKWQKQ